jgi:alkylated DNA repair dioxygenase AlkB
MIYLPEELKLKANKDFDDMFNLKPEEKHVIQIKDAETYVYRFQKNFLNTPPISKFLSDDVNSKYKYRTSYMFSGFDDSKNQDPLPEIFQPYFNFVKDTFKDCDFNQISINWYENGNDYISFHKDCEEYMKGNKTILILTFNEDYENYRNMTLKPISDDEKEIDIPLLHGSILMLTPEFQRKYKHGIRKKRDYEKRRISMSFRQFEF